jgi:hypothetical protein
MTSITRFKISGQALPKPGGVITPTFSSGSNDLAVPFTFNKQGGVLDFNFSGGFTAATSIQRTETVFVQGSTFTALSMVNSVGPNFIAWCENGANNLLDGSGNPAAADAGSVVLYNKPIIVRANQLEINLQPDNNVESFNSGFTTPINFELAAGSQTINNYYTTFLFRTPMVIEYKVSGITLYAVFNTQFEGNS